MGQITAPLSIADSAAVANLFTPRAVSAEQTVLRKAGASALGDYRLTLGFKASTSARPTTRVDVSFEMPILDSAATVPTLVGKGLFKGYFVIPDTFTLTQRKDLRALVANALDATLIQAYVNDLDPIWG